MNRYLRAFTLLELLLTLSILTILITIVVKVVQPDFLIPQTNQLKIENDKSEIIKAYTDYKVKYGGDSPFGQQLIPGIAYRICKANIGDCTLSNWEVSLNNLITKSIIQNIPEVPDNNDARYTGYLLSEIDGTNCTVDVAANYVYTALSATPGRCFSYAGLNYCVVQSGASRLWLDRNLGATTVASNTSDTNAFGDLYQYGRSTDGHEKRTSSTASGPTNNLVPGTTFLTRSASLYNWYNGTNLDSVWQGVNGINNPCPPTWRLPTDEEWNQEKATWSNQNIQGGFNSPLKLVLAGQRSNTGVVQQTGTAGNYWTMNLNPNTDNAKSMLLNTSLIQWENSAYRVLGKSVRCIKETNTVTIVSGSQIANILLLSDNQGMCNGNLQISGTYKQGVNLTSANKVEMDIFVASIGSYAISTDTINGYSFQVSGTFNSTGNTRITLQNNNGTPSTSGINTFTASGSNTSCKFIVNVSS